MMGSMFAGTEEAPGEVELYQGRSYKSYRGMGSLGAMSGKPGLQRSLFPGCERRDGKARARGHRGPRALQGAGSAIIHQLMGGVRSSMGYTGSVDIETMRTPAAFRARHRSRHAESHVHDVSITKEAPNYPVS
jgi:IMP dehydrogenase